MVICHNEILTSVCSRVNVLWLFIMSNPQDVAASYLVRNHKMPYMLIYSTYKRVHALLHDNSERVTDFHSL